MKGKARSLMGAVADFLYSIKWFFYSMRYWEGGVDRLDMDERQFAFYHTIYDGHGFCLRLWFFQISLHTGLK